MYSAGVRFKVRSAKERQQDLLHINERKKDIPRFQPNSGSSPDANLTNRRPRVLNQVSLTKEDEWPVRPKTSDSAQEKPDSLENSSTKMRGRTEWRQEYTSNRSKSLGWREIKPNESKVNQTVVIRDIDFDGSSVKNSEGPETKGTSSRPILNKLNTLLNKGSLLVNAKNKPEVSVKPSTLGTPDYVRNPSTQVRGRTDWRQENIPDRSKSLGWRGAKRQGREETLVIRDNKDFEGNSSDHSEGSERKWSTRGTDSNKPTRHSIDFSDTKTADLSLSPDEDTASQLNTDFATLVRGRAELKREHWSNRSKSLDWRGTRNPGRRESHLEAISDTLNSEGKYLDHLEKPQTTESPRSSRANDQTNHSVPLPDSDTKKILPLDIETSDSAQGNSGFIDNLVTNVRGRSEARPSFMSNRSRSLDWKARRDDRRQTMVIRDIDLNGSSEEHSESLEKNDLPKASNPKELRSSLNLKPSQTTGQAVVSETSPVEKAKVHLALDRASGGLALPSRLKRKQSLDSPEIIKSPWWTFAPSSQKPKDITNAKDSMTTRSIVGGTNGFNFNQNRMSPTKDSGLELPPTLSKKWVSSNLEKGGTFPRMSKGTGLYISPVSIELPGGEETLLAPAEHSKDENNLTGSPFRKNIIDSLERAKKRHGISRVDLEDLASLSVNPQEKIKENLEDQSEITDVMKSAESEKHPEDDDVFEIMSLKSLNKKKEGLQETNQIPSTHSVRNKIHKFEALFQKNQSSASALPFRRTYSVQEKSNLGAVIHRNLSDASLSLRKDDWKKESLKESLVIDQGISDEVPNSPDRNGPVYLPGLSLRPQSKAANNLNSGDFQMTSNYGLSSNEVFKAGVQKNDTKTNLNSDEPDFSRMGSFKLKNHVTEERFRHDVEPATSQVTSDESGGSTAPSAIFLEDNITTYTDHSSPKSNLPGDAVSKPKETNAFHSGIDTLVLPNLPTSDKSTIFSGSSQKPFNSFVDSSASEDLKSLSNTINDKKVAAKVSRWIMGDGVGSVTKDDYEDDEDLLNDEDDETEKGDDSDSGDSSVTITSNMSRSDHMSFSVSLVDLCSLGGLDYPLPDSSGLKDNEDWTARRTASLNSDVSALSSVTLLGTDELDKLLDDVRGLGEDAIQNFEDIQVVVLHKEVGCGLGFTVAGGIDQNKPVTVHRVIPHGLADQEGSIHEGDHVLSINGTALHNSSHQEALQTLRRARKRAMAVVVVRRGDVETFHSSKDSPKIVSGNPGIRVRVILMKSSHDLGFCLEGGVGSSVGDKPLIVQRLFQGGPIGKVFPGDELLEVEGQSLAGLRRLEAWNLIKRLPPGPVEVLLHRSHQPP